MSWLFFAALLTLVLVYVLTPLLAQPKDSASLDNEELTRIRDELQQLSDTETSPAKADLELRAVAILDSKNQTPVGSSGLNIVLLSVFFVASASFLYATIGSPSYEAQSERMAGSNGAFPPDMSLEELAASLAQKLSADPDPPARGYQLLGRSLMALGEYDNAITAYEQALLISDNASDIQAEYERAQQFLASLPASAPALSDAQMDAFQELSPQERDTLIEGMVEGLAARLKETPEDFDGWERLLRSRLVLGQLETAKAEVAAGIAQLDGQSERQIQLRDLAATLGIDASVAE